MSFQSREAPHSAYGGSSTDPLPKRGREIRGWSKGEALLIATMMISLLIATMLVVDSVMLASYKHQETQYTYTGQAVNVAEAGLTDAFSWFKRQTTQPVTAFAPKLDLSALPPVNETDDPSVGLVREYQLSEGDVRYGRYEVWTSQVQDGTAERGLSGAGSIWFLKSIGIVYNKINPALPFNQAPNQVLDSAVMISEIQRLPIFIPVGAAIMSAHRGSWVQLGIRAYVTGPGYGYGVTYEQSTGSPTNTGTTLAGFTANYQPMDPAIYNLSPPNVFGVDKATLASMADVNVQSVNDLPNPLPAMSLIYINSNATFTSSNPLVGSGILFVNGKLSISGEGHSFSGLIYTTDEFYMDAVGVIYGTIMAGYELGNMGNNIRVQGTGGDFAEVIYDPNLLNQVRQAIGQYRLVKSPVLIDTQWWCTPRLQLGQSCP